MAKPRIPLPKQTEQVHRDRKSQYDRRRAKQVQISLDEVYSDPTNQPSPKYLASLKRLQAKAVKENSLEDDTPCLRDLKMDLSRENFDKGQVSEKEFEEAILRADQVCTRCQNPVCRFPKER
jgi:hypothetical protein